MFSDDPRTNSEDALILKVIEAYCTSAKTRHTVNSCKYSLTKCVCRNVVHHNVVSTLYLLEHKVFKKIIQVYGQAILHFHAVWLGAITFCSWILGFWYWPPLNFEWTVPNSKLGQIHYTYSAGTGFYVVMLMNFVKVFDSIDFHHIII
jgi:hypothetical protein